MVSSRDDEKPQSNLFQVLGKRGSEIKNESSSSKRKKQADSELEWTNLGQGCRIGFGSRCVPKEQHDDCFQALLDEAPWRRCEVIMFGKPVMQPREICYMADSADLGYKYSGTEMVVELFENFPHVQQLKKLAEKVSEEKYNSCLLNLYHNGQEYMGWHSDDETVYGKDAPICSVSLGQQREFYLRKKSDHKHKLEYRLGQGDIFVMKGATQTFWQHSVPKRKGVPSARISLTFRCVKHPVRSK